MERGSGRDQRHPPNFNVTIYNVPVPPYKIYQNGHFVKLQTAQNLNVTIYSVSLSPLKNLPKQPNRDVADLPEFQRYDSLRVVSPLKNLPKQQNRNVESFL